MPSLVLEATWAAAGGTVIIYLAALVSVPAELYDAAEVDGASVLRKVWHVTMPQLRGVLLITLILQIIGTVQVFLEPFLFTNGGPNHATETVMLHVYNLAFASLGNNFGQATALSLMLAVFLGVMSLVYFRVDAILEPVVTITDATPTVRTQRAARHGRGRCARQRPGGDDPSAPPRGAGDDSDRGALSSSDWRRRPVKYTWRTMHFAAARAARRSGASARSCCWRSSRSRRRRTSSRSRSRSSRTARPCATSSRPGTGTTSASTS